MYQVAREIVFRSGHFLRFGSDQQEEPHPHDWRIRAVVESSQLNADELVMDFEELREQYHDGLIDDEEAYEAGIIDEQGFEYKD